MLGFGTLGGGIPQGIPSHFGHQRVHIQMSFECVIPTDPLRDVLLMHNVAIGSKALRGDPGETQGSRLGLIVGHVEVFQRWIFDVVGRIDLINGVGRHSMDAFRT